MSLATLIRRTAVILLLLAGAAQWWLWQRTQDELARLTARLIPHGELRYQHAWPFLWGGARIWGLSFQPEGLLRVGLHAAPGAALRIRELRIRRLRLAADGTLSQIEGSAFGASLPLSSLHGIVASGPDHLPVPSPADLGEAWLQFDLDFRVRYVAPSQLAQVALTASGPLLGNLYLNTGVEGTRQVFARAPEQMLIRALTLEWADGGLLERYKDVAAARARLTRPAWEHAVIARLDRRARAERWQWQDDTAAAVRQVVRRTPYLRLRLDPPGDVVLNNIRLYRMGDWPALLGFELSTMGGFEHPLPARTWP